MAVDILNETHNEALALCDRAIDLLESNNDEITAFRLMQQAFELYPTSPKINSWIGYLYGVHENKIALGLKHCKSAIQEGEPDAIYYRNIGKLYLLQKNKRAAIGAFARGLQLEENNQAILKEWSTLGFRRRSLIPFLSRGFFLNKWWGKLTWKFSPKNKERQRIKEEKRNRKKKKK